MSHDLPTLAKRAVNERCKGKSWGEIFEQLEVNIAKDLTSEERSKLQQLIEKERQDQGCFLA